MKSWVCWRDGCNREILRVGCDGELGVMDSCVYVRDGELLRAGCDGELGVMVNY